MQLMKPLKRLEKSPAARVTPLKDQAGLAMGVNEKHFKNVF
jgi:hypothetical protein